MWNWRGCQASNKVTDEDLVKYRVRVIAYLPSQWTEARLNLQTGNSWVPLKEEKDCSVDSFETVIFARFLILSLCALTHGCIHAQVCKHTQAYYLKGLTTLMRTTLSRKKFCSFIESC